MVLHEMSKNSKNCRLEYNKGATPSSNLFQCVNSNLNFWVHERLRMTYAAELLIIHTDTESLWLSPV